MAKSRDREATQSRLIEAVGTILERDGVGALGVNAIAKEAKANKALIYRYFDGLRGLYRAYGEKADIWPSIEELLGGPPEDLRDQNPAELAKRFFQNYYQALTRRPRTIDLMAWECVGRNELIIMLEELRERRSEELGECLSRFGLFDITPEIGQFLMLLTGSIHYFLIRRRNIRIFGGVDIQSDEGWEQLLSRIEEMIELRLL